MTRVILLPGLASDAALWRHQLPALTAAGHTVHVTDAHARADTLSAMARWVLAEHEGPLVLVGTSMGGILALEVFRQAPQRVAALAVLGRAASWRWRGSGRRRSGWPPWPCWAAVPDRIRPR